MYHNVDEFESAILNLVNTYPSIAERITLPFPSAALGRSISCLRIGSNTASGRDGILFLFGQHAREWVPPEVGLNLMADILPAYANNESLTYGFKTYSAAEIREIVDSVNIFIITCANPDGHLFTQSWQPADDLPTKESHLRWRKNRNPAHNHVCHGVDLNRNYDFAFKLDKYFNLNVSRVNMYNSASHCLEIYQGPHAFSEPETQNIRWLFDSYQRIRWFVDVHAHTQTGEIYYPWGDDENQDKRPAMNWQNEEFDHQRGDEGVNTYREYKSGVDHATHQALANRLEEGVNAVRNGNYLVKQIASLYVVSGSATDWIWSRHLTDPSLPRVDGFAIEVKAGGSTSPFQYGFQPLPEIKDELVKEVTSGLINFSLATVCGLGISALPASLNVVFNSIPEGRIASRPVILRVTGCWGATFRVIAGPTKTSGAAGIVFGVAVGTRSVPIPAENGPVTRELYLWLTVQGGLEGETATGTVRVECPDTGEAWDVSLNANFVRAPRAGAVLILDRSGSMSEDAGDGRTRLQVLLESAPAFVEVAPPKTRVGLVRFATDASSGAPMTTMGPEGVDPGRKVILDAIEDHTLATGGAGATSIGDGVHAGTALIAPENDVDFKSLIVLTDGHENQKRFLSDIMSQIHNRVFAIGLGRAQDIQPIALDTLTNKTGGYMLMTGKFDGDDPYRLAKYYLQILTGVTNNQVVVDPDGFLPVGAEHNIPFYLNEADQSIDAIVLTPFPEILSVRLRTPGGETFDNSHPSLQWTRAEQIGFFRFTLPVPGKFAKEGPGLWQLLLGWPTDWKKRWDRLNHSDFFPGKTASNSVRYKVMVHARSEVGMAAAVAQNSRTPGARVSVRVRLTQFESVPIEGAKARAFIEFPDKSVTTLPLHEDGDGVYKNKFTAELYGSYPMRISAEGHSLRGFPFTREAFRTALIWRGGDNPPPNAGSHGGGNTIFDLLKENVIDPKVLERAGVNVERLKAFFQPEESEEPIRGEVSGAAQQRTRGGKNGTKRKRR